MIRLGFEGIPSGLIPLAHTCSALWQFSEARGVLSGLAEGADSFPPASLILRELAGPGVSTLQKYQQSSP